jgi:hypothetical protein
MLGGSAVAGAQLIDPSTGVMVDPTSDPSDFAAVAAGQPGNIGMELNAQAITQMQAQAAQAAQTSSNLFASDDSDTTSAPAAPVLARTPKPVMTPNGGSFQGSVQVTIADKDTQAAIHYTTDGSTPTLSSPLYIAPLTVTAKTKVRALAAATGEAPSGVLTKTFKVKP